MICRGWRGEENQENQEDVITEFYRHFYGIVLARKQSLRKTSYNISKCITKQKSTLKRTYNSFYIITSFYRTQEIFDF